VIEFQAKRGDEVYKLILNDRAVIEVREFKNHLKAKEFFHRRKIQHKNNGWEKFQTKIPTLSQEKSDTNPIKKRQIQEGRTIRIFGYPVRIED